MLQEFKLIIVKNDGINYKIIIEYNCNRVCNYA